MSLPKEIYVWDETPEKPDYSLNIEANGARPTPEDETTPRRAGIYQLVREVDIINDVKEVEVKPATDPYAGLMRNFSA